MHPPITITAADAQEAERAEQIPTLVPCLWFVEFEPRQRGGRQRRDRFVAIATTADEAIRKVAREQEVAVSGRWFAEEHGSDTVSLGHLFSPKLPREPVMTTVSDQEAETLLGET